MEMCACGQPLHYSDPKTQAMVQEMVDTFGPLIRVSVGGRTWKVPRHYIALHGLRAQDLPDLDFEEVAGDD